MTVKNIDKNENLEGVRRDAKNDETLAQKLKALEETLVLRFMALNNNPKILVQRFDEAIKKHPIKPIDHYYFSNEDLDRDDQMKHYLQRGKEGYLAFSFEGNEEEAEKLRHVFLNSYTLGNGTIVYVDARLKIGGEKVMYYICYYERTHTFKIEAWSYPGSLDDEVIKRMRGDLEMIDDMLKMDFETIKLFETWRRLKRQNERA